MDKESIGAKIQEYRELKGYTRAELAAKANISKVSIWKIETGKSYPRLDTAIGIATALGIPPSLLLV